MEESVLPGQQSLAGIDFDSSTINSMSPSSSSSMQIDPTTEFSILIEKLSPILNEMKDSIELRELPSVQKAFESLETDYERAKAAIYKQNIQSSPAKHIEYLTQNLGRSLGLVLFMGHDVPISNRQRIEALCKEMMKVKFELSSSYESEFANDETEEKTETEIVEEDTDMISIDDVIMQIRQGDEETLKNAILGLNILITEGAVSNEKIIDEDIINMLFNKLSSCKGNSERLIILQILKNLTVQNLQHKERLKDLQFLSVLVKSLTRETEEQREALRLLLNLCDDPGVRRKIGRIQGCIVMLVAISNGDDTTASADAKEILSAMSSNTQHALHMAEAGYFKPLIKYLKEGSDVSKVLMATALSRMELSDEDKASLGENGAIEPLVKMFKTGNLEAKLSSLKALQILCILKQNIQRLVKAGLVVALLQLLFSVTSVLMTLREPASAILAKVAESESILVKHDVAQQMLSLLSLSSPVIQSNLLEALNNITSHSSASKVRKKMKENGAIQLLVRFFTETDTRIRTSALKLVYTLSTDIQGELTEQIGYTNVNVIASIALSSSTTECEKAAALGILSNLPISDQKITDILKNTKLLHVLIPIMSSTPADSTPTTKCLVESVAGILIRFTVPSDRHLQHYAVENGIIPVLLKLLSSSSSELAKCRAALCLAQLSQNSLHLSRSKKLKCFCLPPSGDTICEVHDGYCSIKRSFCLIKTGAITPLIQILEGEQRDADEAVLNCLSTLVQDEIWENGCNYIVKKSGVEAIIKVLEFGNLKAQEKALWLLERIFRVETHRGQYSEPAQVVLVHLAQNGDPMLKPIVANLLEQLEILHVPSS